MWALWDPGCVCVCVFLRSADLGCRTQVSTKNTNCCHRLGGQDSREHLEPHGARVGMASHAATICDCQLARPWMRGGWVSAITTLASGCCVSSKRHMPACHRIVSACHGAENRALASQNVTPATSLLPVPKRPPALQAPPRPQR